MGVANEAMDDGEIRVHRKLRGLPKKADRSHGVMESANHSEMCRKRIEEAIENDEKGKKVKAGSDERIRQHKERSMPPEPKGGKAEEAEAEESADIEATEDKADMDEDVLREAGCGTDF